MIIANIVCTSKLKVPPTINVVESIGEITQGLPTLIVGYDYVNKNYSDFDIIDRTLGKNLYWTFKRTEKRDMHDEDVLKFVSKVYYDLIENIKYVFVDPIHYRGVTMIKIIKKILSLKKPTIYVGERMIYIYGENLLFGIDLMLLKYMDLNVDKITKKVIGLSDRVLGEDDKKRLLCYPLSSLRNREMLLPFFDFLES